MTKHWRFLKPPKRNTEKILEDIYTARVGWKCSPAFGQNQIKGIQLIMCLKLFLIISILPMPDRKSTRLNSSHVRISYAVFCLKKKKKQKHIKSFPCRRSWLGLAPPPP